MSEPQYSASSAANVVLLIALVSAVVFGIAGFVYLRRGDELGWLLLLLGVLPLLFSAIIRSRVRRSDDRG
ncbi:MAG: hypothetical protein WD766_05445 [Gemmatimonadota bacterium]